MSLNIDKKKGVRLKTSKKAGGVLFAALIIIEAIFTFFLYLSIAGKIFAPPQVQSASGVPELISYQGRLTDTSGNPLGGAGTVYCFRYYIYDAASAGNQLWPLGNVSSTNSTATVTDGVFSDQIGRTDTLATQDFMTTSTLYLQVQVNTTTSTCSGTWENLAPRQQIVSTAFSQTSQNIYGAALKTATSSKVQVGTGGGVPAGGQTLLTLDWANSTSTTDIVGGSCTGYGNGSLWYNSKVSRAFVCDGGIIQEIGNGDVINGVQSDSTTTLISTGNVVLSAYTNITISQTGNTLKFSAAAPGGGGGARPGFVTNIPPMHFSTGGTPGVWAVAANSTHSTMLIIPISVGGSISVKSLGFMLSRSSGTTLAQSIYAGIYSDNNSTLALIASTSGNFSLSATAQWANARRYDLTGLNTVELGPGMYYVGLRIAVTSGGIYLVGINSASVSMNSVTFQPGTNNSAANVSLAAMPYFGSFSTGAIPNSIPRSSVRGATNIGLPYVLITEIP